MAFHGHRYREMLMVASREGGPTGKVNNVEHEKMVFG